MNWRFISSKFLFLSLLLAACTCNNPQQTTDTSTTDWHALEKLPFKDLPLSQGSLNEYSTAWANALKHELRNSWNPKVREGNVEDWFVSQHEEVKRDLAGTEDGSIYSLNFNLELGDRIFQELRKHKGEAD